MYRKIGVVFLILLECICFASQIKTVDAQEARPKVFTAKIPNKGVLTNSIGSIVERYEYDAYGNPTILDTQYAPHNTKQNHNSRQHKKFCP